MNFQEKKHLALLFTILLVLCVQPFTHGTQLGLALFDFCLSVAAIIVLLIVFERPAARAVALCVVVPAIVCNWLLYVVDDEHFNHLAVLYHLGAALFYALAVAAILHDAFRKNVILADQVLAGVNGFLLAGIAWGNLYLVVDLLSPNSFSMTASVTRDLADVHMRRFEFNHLSFVTLTGLGYGDITPVGHFACTLSWLEATFSQFYMAIVIGLLVGLKMAALPAAQPRQSDSDTD